MCEHKAVPKSTITIQVKKSPKGKAYEEHVQEYTCRKCGEKVQRTISPYLLMGVFSV